MPEPSSIQGLRNRYKFKSLYRFSSVYQVRTQLSRERKLTLQNIIEMNETISASSHLNHMSTIEVVEIIKLLSRHSMKNLNLKSKCYEIKQLLNEF